MMLPSYHPKFKLPRPFDEMLFEPEYQLDAISWSVVVTVRDKCQRVVVIYAEHPVLQSWVFFEFLPASTKNNWACIHFAHDGIIYNLEGLDDSFENQIRRGFADESVRRAFLVHPNMYTASSVKKCCIM